MCIGFRLNDILYKGVLEIILNGVLIMNEYM